MAKRKMYDGEIEFDDLMEYVNFVGTVGGRYIKKPYILELNGTTKYFEDTSDVVPFVEEHMNIKVTHGEAHDFNS